MSVPAVSAVCVFKSDFYTGLKTHMHLRLFANEEDALKYFLNLAAAALFVRDRGMELNWAVGSLVSVVEELTAREKELQMTWVLPGHVVQGLIDHEEFECERRWGAVLCEGTGSQFNWDASRKIAYAVPLVAPSL